MKAFFLILFAASTVLAAHPTGTVTRAVMVDGNGVLFGSDTNFARLNGIADTASVANVAANLAVMSNIVSGAVKTNHVGTVKISGDLYLPIVTPIVISTNILITLGDASPSTIDGYSVAGVYVYQGATNLTLGGDYYLLDNYTNANGAAFLLSHDANSASWFLGERLEYGPAPRWMMNDLIIEEPSPEGVYTPQNGTCSGTYTGAFQFVNGTLTNWIRVQDFCGIWRTNQIPGFGGTTNTIIYLGAP